MPKPMDKYMEQPSFYTKKWLVDFTVQSVEMSAFHRHCFARIVAPNPQMHLSHDVRAAINARLNDTSKIVQVEPAELMVESSDYQWLSIYVTWPTEKATASKMEGINAT
jgi:hypothetical protein